MSAVLLRRGEGQHPARLPVAVRQETVHPGLEEDPTTNGGYSYRAPATLSAWFASERNPNDTAQSRVPVQGGSGLPSGLLIFTDKEEAEVEYIMRKRTRHGIRRTLSWRCPLRLASYIAPRPTAGDPYKLGERALQLHALEVGRAKESSVDEEQDEQLPDSELIRERE